MFLPSFAIWLFNESAVKFLHSHFRESAIKRSHRSMNGFGLRHQLWTEVRSTVCFWLRHQLRAKARNMLIA